MDFSAAINDFDPSLLESNAPFAPILDLDALDGEGADEDHDAYDESDEEDDFDALLEIEDEAILMEDHLELMALGRAAMDEAQSSRFSECATNGQVCTCDGVALYGAGTSWLSLRSNGTVLCTGDTFGETQHSVTNTSSEASKGCRCYSMSWCAANKPSDGLEYKTDEAHRRRTLRTTQGIDGHQRRRWCGWGPRDCVWAAWSDFGSCSVSCGGGTKTRQRQPATVEANGGTCKGEKVETASCNTDTCPPK
mmetsp:Transcript_36241/g.54683  ORF Transcript_36241/g.54683 Transcript_36241/m.54683 type:complete len:251 (+) Transcript_36241:1-753(+)